MAKQSFKINTGKTDDEEKLKGKVPKVSDMEEGSDAEEATESPEQEAKETKQDGDEGGDSGGNTSVDKETLKDSIREVQMEKDLEYTVNNRSKEELQCLIKMAQAKIDSNDFKGKDKSSPQISKY